MLNQPQALPTSLIHIFNATDWGGRVYGPETKAGSSVNADRNRQLFNQDVIRSAEMDTSPAYSQAPR